MRDDAEREEGRGEEEEGRDSAGRKRGRDGEDGDCTAAWSQSCWGTSVLLSYTLQDSKHPVVFFSVLSSFNFSSSIH